MVEFQCAHKSAHVLVAILANISIASLPTASMQYKMNKLVKIQTLYCIVSKIIFILLYNYMDFLINVTSELPCISVYIQSHETAYL